MAKLHNLKYITLDPAVCKGREGETIKVGNNRTVRFTTHGISGQQVLSCFLHGTEIVQFHAEQPGFIEMILSHGGHRTRTTASAIQDFLRAMGYPAGVSMAGGEMNVSIQGLDGRIEKTEECFGEIYLMLRSPAYDAERKEYRNA